MKSVKEIAMELLLKGEHINKSDFRDKYNTFTLTQRIQEIRDGGWNVLSKTIPGRKGMVEYWLEPDEINRIKNTQYKAISEQEQKDEELPIRTENIAEKPNKAVIIEEQMGLGLPWQ